MANYWALAIGINQYQCFQPLSCAQADAEALRDFLVTEARFPHENCLLMTDSSPPMRERSTVPSKENILYLIEELSANSFKPSNPLCLFFSGYGVNHNHKDYLMPVDGNPEEVEKTGIEVSSLLQSLQVTGVDLLVLLDINHALGSESTIPVGQETLEIARELQIPLILSCQPDQYSYESSDLGHGFFTATVLEAMRLFGCNDLREIERYIRVRTPELCQHYWRPSQNPIAIIPKYVLSQPHEIVNDELQEDYREEESFVIQEQIFASVLEAPSLQPTVITRKEEENLPTSNPIETTPQPVSQKSIISTPAPNPPFWRQLFLWAGSTALVMGLILVVFQRNQIGLKSPGLSSGVSKIDSPNSNTNDDKASLTSTAANPNEITASQTTTTNDKNQNNQNESLQALPNPTVVVTTTPTYTASTQAASQSSPIKNSNPLELAKISLGQAQATDLKKAIIKAQEIKPGEASYEEAQERVGRWTRTILDLAEGRASKSQYSDAIAAAELISEREPLYKEAQDAIQKWREELKQYTSNKTVLDAANALIDSRQASTYNRAIEVARKVPLGQPAYDKAKKSINDWSEKILTIANNRANDGEYKAAIKTATLVPQDTEAYARAQEAIQKWQGLLKQ
jgi:uncharacterized caspase-like protein